MGQLREIRDSSSSGRIQVIKSTKIQQFLRSTYKLQSATYCMVYVYVSISHEQKLPLTIIFPSEVIYPKKKKIGMITFSDKRMNLSIGNRVYS